MRRIFTDEVGRRGRDFGFYVLAIATLIMVQVVWYTTLGGNALLIGLFLWLWYWPITYVYNRIERRKKTWIEY